MILDKEVEIIVHSKVNKYYLSLGYNSISRNKLIVKIEHLTKGSKAKINVKCYNKNCANKNKLIPYQNYIKFTKNLTESYYCEKCNYIKNKKTKLENHGDENYNNRNLFKETMIERYCVEHALQNKKINEKQQKTMAENYGIKYALQKEEFLEKSKQTCLKNNDVEYPSQNKEIKEKTKKTNNKKYGGNSPMCNKEIQKKYKKTMYKRYGVCFPMQNPILFKQARVTSGQIFQYKKTNLTYQAGYEKYFLELMEEYGFINELSMGKLYDYVLNESLHVYHSDYLFRGKTIEIKSVWTYDRNGTNKKLGLQNEAKWQAVHDSYDELLVLWTKREIRDYVMSLSAK